MSRYLLVAFFLSSFAAGLPGAEAQTQFGVVPSLLLLEDPVGDVAAGSYSNPSLTVPVSQPTADLLSLSVSETPSAILAYLGVAAVPDESTPTGQQVRASYSLAFRYETQDFVAYISGSPPGGAAEAYRGTFCKGTWEQQETCLDGMELAVLPGAKSFGIQITKESLGELSGVQPVMGMQVDNWRALAYLARPLSNDFWVGDHLNDPITDQAAYEFQFGIPQSGPLQMSGKNLYIVSNGLATSYPFRLNLTNSLEQAQQVRLTSKNVPPGWQVTLPEATISVPPGGTQSVVVVLTVPFRHAHGSIERFVVEAQDSAGMPLTSLDMGLIYTETPQPTGHHNNLYIHSFAGGQSGFMSTLSEDSGDSGEGIRGQMQPSGTTLFDVFWKLDLQPGLAVGLDFDPMRQGTLEVPIFTAIDTPNMHLVGSLAIEGNGGMVPVAQVSSNKVNGAAQQTTTLAADIIIEPDADLVTFKPGTNLVLLLTLASDLGVWTPNDIMPGGWLSLPLFDYHDDVDAAIASLSGLTWSSETSTGLRGPPGSDIVVPIVLESSSPDAKRIRVQIDSSPEGIASFSGPQEAVVRPGSPLAGQLVIRIPDSAQTGELLDVVLIAQDQAGSGALAVHRVAIIVDPTAPASQFTPTETPTKESPTPSGIVLIVLLVALLLKRRN